MNCTVAQCCDKFQMKAEITGGSNFLHDCLGDLKDFVIKECGG